jgi:glycogen operon protein
VRAPLLLPLLALLACGSEPPAPTDDPSCAASGDGLGATLAADGCLTLRVFSANATRLEAWLYAGPTGADAGLRLEMIRSGEVWTATASAAARAAAGIGETVYYGYRAWGPNWPYDADWEPGTSRGIRSDVDVDGNRFNPNKLLYDPYALEISHDPGPDHRPYATGPEYRDQDSGPLAPKSVALPREAASFERPIRERSDDVVYEVHVRGLTMADPSIPAELRGTYAGAALKAPYLAELGITAIELLPLHETQNDFNDEVESTDGDNYWGYASLSFFAPDRRYAADRSPGGPSREVRDMVRAFHAEGIKVYLDVVYNHTAETYAWDRDGRTATLFSWRGLDAASYYQLGERGHQFRDDNGVGPNVNVARPAVADMVIDSLAYWHRELGVDGFRFDLASILGNQCDRVCFDFAADRGLLARIGDELSTADLIAEPWSITSYQMGEFAAPWGEWNDQFRDTIRRHQNKLGIDPVTPGDLALRLGGSPDRFADDGRQPWHSVNFVVAHDGFTLHDLFACNEKQNDQPWPLGPSPGGSDNNISWDQGGDPALQRQAARTAMALLLLAPGVPMITGGDEFLRTQHCNNNPFNLDSAANWLDWEAAAAPEAAAFTDFTGALLALRRATPALRPEGYPATRWLTDAGALADEAYLGNAGNRFLAWALESGHLWVGYNGSDLVIDVSLPEPPDGAEWALIADTGAAREGSGNSFDPEPVAGPIPMAPRTLMIAIAQ